jgi:hypothetical protein
VGYFNVVSPCVVGKVHHVRPTAQPIEVDDAVAAPLVESGRLEAYPKSVKAAQPAQEPEPEVEAVETEEVNGLEELVGMMADEPFDDEPPTDPPPPRRPRSRKRSED